MRQFSFGRGTPIPTRSSLALLFCLGLAACGGGGGGGIDPPPPPPDPTGDLAPKATYSDTDRRHLLARTHFAVRAGDLASVQAVGLPAYVDAMLNLPPIGSTQVEQQANALLVNPSDPPNLQGGFPSHEQLGQWWAYLLQRSTTPFQEVVAMFWHDHFAASNAVLEQDRTYWTKAHVNLWRGQGTGNLRTMGVAMARDWLMLQWLDGILNTAIAPNENFAREFYELFFLGVDQGYVQSDILEAARAWTGYRTRSNVTTNQTFVEFDPSRHDTGSKVIFGATIQGQNQHDDFQQMVDITFAQRPVETFIARKILEAFCYEDPPQAVVDDLGAILRQSNWELKPVFRTLFLSEAFYSDKAKSGFVKSPVEHVVGFARATNLWMPERFLDAVFGLLGQRPTQPPTVNGWPVGEAWLGAQQMVDRANVTNFILALREFQGLLGQSVGALLPPGTPTTAQVVDALVAALNLTPSASEHAAYVTYLDTGIVGGVPTPDPFNPSDPFDVELRVRGLLYILTQHPAYPIR
jgi:hypothetical protein